MSFSKIYLGMNAESLEVTPRFEAYTGVRVRADSKSEPITAGNETGRVLDVECLYASQTIADQILAQIQGYSYQPYNAGGALLEPAAEIGDGITIGSIYGGLFAQDTSFGRLSISSISSPSDEELAHEFGYTGEDGKYATYASLANGSASINGAGLQKETVTGAKIANSTIGAGKTTFSGTLDQVGTNASNISVLQGDIAALNGYFGDSYANRVNGVKVYARDELHYMGYLVRLYNVKDTNNTTRTVLGIY